MNRRCLFLFILTEALATVKDIGMVGFRVQGQDLVIQKFICAKGYFNSLYLTNFLLLTVYHSDVSLLGR